MRPRPTMLFALLFTLGCPPEGDDTAALGPRGDCNPVGGGENCLLPFPSSFFLDEDATTGSGYRVHFGPETLPINENDVRTDPAYWNELDGFPTLGALYAYLPGVTVTGAISHQDLDAYAASDARTVVLNAENGERLPHWVEKEVRVVDPEREALLLRPAVPMEHATRYVVGLRGLVDEQGAALPPVPGFAALRDGSASEDPDLERQREHYEQHIFPVLEQAGFARSELQLAWDFVTVSQQGSLGRMLWMRDDALQRVGEAGPPVTFEILSEDDCSVENPPHIGRTLKGTMTVPLYLESWEEGSNLTRDDDGMPVYNGDQDVQFTVRIPCSLINDPRPGMLLQYGHGLLGSQSEVYTGWLAEVADRHGWVIFATDWTGMKDEDVTAILDQIGSGMSNFATVPERLHQGMIEFLMAARAMQGGATGDPALMQGGTLLYDPASLAFYGISQGSILGGAYAALSPDLSRVALGAGGMPYSLLLTRSHDFELYFIMLRNIYDDDLDITLLIALMEMLWDPTEGSGWAWFLTQRELGDGTPTKRVLVQDAVGDAQVPTIGAQLSARAWGASLVTPATRPVWGLTEREPPFEGSAFVEFGYDVEEPVTAEPCSSETDTHEDARREYAGQEQVALFLEEGIVDHFCDGACDPD
ncbi:MAG: hypothetical protein ABIO70_14050 [Pseudomonadota bacterium]